VSRTVLNRELVRLALVIVAAVSVFGGVFVGVFDGVAQAQERQHTVKAGDTLSRIAKKYGVTIDQLRAWNQLKNDNLREGAVLTVSGAAATKKTRRKELTTEAPGTGPESPRLARDPDEIEIDDAFCARIEQAWKPELIRSYFRADCTDPKVCVARHMALHDWRTERYGYYPGFGKRSANGFAPVHYTRDTVFQGIHITINENLVAPLRCIERKLATSCATCAERPELPGECSKKFPYHPRHLSGLRTKNTFRGGEVSNHVYGIAVDVDPSDNTCCGCVGKWKSHPMCRKKGEPHERMIMPYCWVEVFESYGFYWLGRDKLQDTMHFEFLGDPAIVQAAVKDATLKPK